MKLLAGVFVVLELVFLGGQITTLVSTYWTSWDLRFNWTQSGGEFNRRPDADGQIVSQGHAGLWSRCVKVYSTDKDGNHPQVSADHCLHNYENISTSEEYTFGKACKTATAALCVSELAITLTVLTIVLVTILWWRGPRLMKKVPLSLLLLQGLICFTIPMTYISGNMAELIDQLSSAYGLLLIVGLGAGYAHDWAFWLQVGLIPLWIALMGLYVVLYEKVHRRLQQSSLRTNGKKKSSFETAEMQPLNKI